MSEPLLHILNPNKHRREAVAAYFQNAPAFSAIQVERTQHPTHLETVVQWGIEQGAKHLVIWGGDGSLSRAVQAVYEAGQLANVTFSLVPVGTCNDFARYLGYSLPAVVDRAFDGAEERIDLGLMETNGRRRVFINNAGFGRSAVGSRRTRPQPLRDIFRLDEKVLSIEHALDGVRAFESGSFLFGMVCNAPYFSGGLCFDPTIQAADGVLTSFFYPPENRMALLSRFVRARLKKAFDASAATRLDVNELTVESQKPLYPQADGEPATDEPVQWIKFSVLPGALRFIR